MSDRLARADAIDRGRWHRPRAASCLPFACRRRVTASLAAKCVRRAIAMVREHGPDAVTAIVQGRLIGSQIAEGRTMVRLKVQKVEKAEAAAA
jgi:hypothetical protein